MRITFAFLERGLLPARNLTECLALHSRRGPEAGSVPGFSPRYAGLGAFHSTGLRPAALSNSHRAPFQIPRDYLEIRLTRFPVIIAARNTFPKV